MHVQMVTYDRGMMGEQEYIDFAHDAAPRIAAVPGLMATVWFDGAETGTYGGVFFWEDQASMERFTTSPLFESLFGPFGDVLFAHADVLENVTRRTQPSLQILPSGAGEPETGAALGLPDTAGVAGIGRGKRSTAKSRRSSNSPATKKSPAAANKATSVRELAGKPKPASAKASSGAAKPKTARKTAAAGRRAAPKR